jgi:hypothetical protein
LECDQYSDSIGDYFRPYLQLIQNMKGFDERVSAITGMFGAGIYLAENSSKSNQYVPCPNCGRGSIVKKGICNCNVKGNNAMFC